MQAPAFKRYFETVAQHVWIVLACVVLILLAAGIYVTVASPTYMAQSEMLVSPVDSTDTTLVGLPVLHSTGDPTEDVLTAASLMTTPQVAAATVSALHLHESPSALLGQVAATPVGQSNLVAIQATASTASQAQTIANAFAKQVVATRAAALHAAVRAELPGLRDQLAATPPTLRYGPGTIGDELNQLDQLSAGNDPTITLAALATLPTGPTSPRKKLTLLVALLAGLLIGIGAAFAWDALDPRLRREQQLRDLLHVPILARIPRERLARRDRPMLPHELSLAAAEGYRTLRAVLSSRATGKARAILVTGAAPTDGKTTAAINLAAALAQGGSRVILLEADLRRPTIASALDLDVRYGTEDVLIGEADLDEAFITARFEGVPVRVLAVREPGVDHADRLSFAIVQRLINRAKSMADYVVIDSPPLTAVIDALPLAQNADEIVLVARLGNPKLSKIAELRQLLAQQGRPPTGVLVVGQPPSRNDYYYRPRSNGRAGRPADVPGGDLEPLPPRRE